MVDNKRVELRDVRYGSLIGKRHSYETENFPVMSELLLRTLEEADELIRVSRLLSHQYEEKEKKEMTAISSPVEELNVFRSERQLRLRYVYVSSHASPFSLLWAVGSIHPPQSRQRLRCDGSDESNTNIPAFCLCLTFCMSVRRTLLTRFQTICCFFTFKSSYGSNDRT